MANESRCHSYGLRVMRGVNDYSFDVENGLQGFTFVNPIIELYCHSTWILYGGSSGWQFSLYP